MRAVVITKPGGPEVLEIRDTPDPEPSAGEVRVRVSAFGINRADLLQRKGLYPAPPGVPKDIPGLEYAGLVDALGERAEGIAAGDRVMGIVGGGAYAEYVIAPAGQAVSIPDGMPFERAAAIPEAFITAHDAIVRLCVTQGEWVLVHAIGSGVGTAALQLIKARGARCIGTSRTAAKLDRATALGMDAGVDTAAQKKFSDSVLKIAGVGAEAAIDLVGGKLFPETLKSMAPRGHVMLVGLTAGNRADVDLGLILRKRLRLEGTVVRSRSKDEKIEATEAFREAVLPSMASGEINPVVDRTFPLEEVGAAHTYMESNANFGKVVVLIE